MCVLLVLRPGLLVTFEDIRRIGLSSRGVVGGNTPYCDGELVVLVLLVPLPNIGLPLAPVEPDRGVREPAELSLSFRRGETTLGSVGGRTPYCEGLCALVLFVVLVVNGLLVTVLFERPLFVLLSRLPLTVRFALESPVGRTPYCEGV